MPPHLSRDDVRALVASGRLAAKVPVSPPEPTGAPILLEAFVEGPLHNPLNGSHAHWSKHARWARQWRERTSLALFHVWPRPGGKLMWIDALTPKSITFYAYTGATWDDDNLRAGCKPLRDALKDAAIISDDAPDAGHEFIYRQRINRANRGVWVTISPRPMPEGAER